MKCLSSIYEMFMRAINDGANKPLKIAAQKKDLGKRSLGNCPTDLLGRFTRPAAMAKREYGVLPIFDWLQVCRAGN